MKDFLLLIFFISLNLMGDVFELDLKGSMEESIIGAPIYIKTEVRNISSRVQKIAGKFTYDFVLGRTDGKVVKKKPEEQYKVVSCEYVDIKEVGVEGREVEVIDLGMLYEIKEAGSYILEVKLSVMCDRGKGRDGKIEKDVWHGELRKTIKIEIKEPEGVDREAYEYFKGDVPLSGDRAKEVLDKFPTSTYAGWVVEKYIYRPAEYDIEKFYFSLKCNPSNSVPTKDGWQSISGKDYLQWQKEWAERILENHPDFAMKDSLKLLLSVINFWEGDEGKAEEWLKKLPKESKEYKWGREFIEYAKRESKKVRKVN